MKKLISEEKAAEKAMEYSAYMYNLRTHGQSTSVCLRRSDYQEEGFIAGVQFAETELQNTAMEFALYYHSEKKLNENAEDSELFEKFINERKK